MAYSNLIAEALGLEQNRNTAQIAEMAANAQAKPYAPKKVKIMTPEEEKA